MLKRFILIVICALLFLSSAFTVYGDNIYEYYFYPEDAEQKNSVIPEEYSSFIDALPNEIKDKLPGDLKNGNISDFISSAEEITDFEYVWTELVKQVLNTFFPVVKTTLLIIGILILSKLTRLFTTDISSKANNKLIDSIINVAVILTIFATGSVIFEEVERFKDINCNLMNGIIPVFGVVYAASGNGSTAAIQSGGIMLLVTLCQNLFSIILLPSVRICLFMSIANAVFPDSGIKPVATVFKNISVSIMVASVTLFSFILSLQNSIAQTADTFGIRSIKFAVGNIVPIIGGAVSDSLGTIGGSLSLLKKAGGNILIIMVILIILPTLSMLLIRRLSFYLCKTSAEILDCTAEKNLLEDIGSAVSMMLAFSVAISISFIYVLTLFSNSVLAISA